MEVVEGRFDDFIMLPSGRIISPYVTSRYFENIKGIAEYRIVQEAGHRFTIQLVLREGYSDDVSFKLIA